MTEKIWHREAFEMYKAGPLLVTLVGALYAFWTVYVLVGSQETTTLVYANLTFCFSMLAALYLWSAGKSVSSWCSMPVLITLQGLLGFVVMPGWLFLNGDDQVDSNYVKALSIVLVGYVVFWMVCWMLRRGTQLRFIPQSSMTPKRTTVAASCMLCIGVAATVLQWKMRVLAYIASTEMIASTSSTVQWVGACAQLLGGAAVVSGCEVIGKKDNSATVRAVFYLSLGAMLVVGAISGMKGAVMKPIVIVIALSALVKGRISRATWLVIPFLVFFVYPFINSYRDNINSGYRDQIDTVGGLEATVSKSLSDAFAGRSILNSEEASDNINSSTERMSLLGYVHDVIAVPDKSLLGGDEKVYLAPVYPFIPRFLWKDKPVLDKGQRLSVALGIPATSSTAVTEIGDMYILGGMAGVLFGMALFGVVVQTFMNSLGGMLTEKGVFVFLAMASNFINMERDVVSFIAAGIQNALVVLFAAYVIYGGRILSLRSGSYDTPAAVWM